jgi:hypothetical protein
MKPFSGGVQEERCGGWSIDQHVLNNHIGCEFAVSLVYIKLGLTADGGIQHTHISVLLVQAVGNLVTSTIVPDVLAWLVKCVRLRLKSKQAGGAQKQQRPK